MSLKFGTSGLRGLVTALTDPVVARYAAGFAAYLGHEGDVLIGRDLRESSPRIAAATASGLRAAGARPIDCGAVPTPALALESARRGVPAIMVTGSHIPADRNGLKFYTATGEIDKADEAGILAAFTARDTAWADGETVHEDGVLDRYRARYVDAFPGVPLSGMRIGVYQHSSVARDVLVDILTGLGATATALGRSELFIPVDTEAVSPDAIEQLARWSTEFDAIVSTDGDADRPMVADHEGAIVPGDVLGPLTARMLGARIIVTPISSNSLVDLMPDVAEVIRTRIGSPYVIAGMTERMGEAVVGYEANGGFLLGFDVADGPPALMTRDCVLPIIAPLIAASRQGMTLKALCATLPDRHTHADRLAGMDPADAQRLIAELDAGSPTWSRLFEGMGEETSRNTMDGLRLGFGQDRIIHLRPSGNAPELRCYSEAQTRGEARQLVVQTLQRVAALRP